jgi:hypothetical protein
MNNNHNRLTDNRPLLSLSLPQPEGYYYPRTQLQFSPCLNSPLSLAQLSPGMTFQNPSLQHERQHQEAAREKQRKREIAYHLARFHKVQFMYEEDGERKFSKF